MHVVSVCFFVVEKMNIVRRIRGHAGASPKPEDQSLYLTHLKKLFSDVRQPGPGVTRKDLEDKLYNMLPLFCKVSIFWNSLNFSNEEYVYDARDVFTS